MEKKNLKKKEGGASLVEYAFLVVLIVVIAVVALKFVGSAASQRFSQIGNTLATQT